jgi:hypothetical protein
MPWSPTRDASSRELPRLLSQGSLRLRSTLQSQKSLSNLEAASLLRTGSMKVCTRPRRPPLELHMHCNITAHMHTSALKHMTAMQHVNGCHAPLQQVNVALGGDKEPSEALARRSAIRARLEDLDANSDGASGTHVCHLRCSTSCHTQQSHARALSQCCCFWCRRH